MEQTQTSMKTFGQRFRLFKQIQPVYLEWTSDNRVIMRALNPVTSSYDITLFEVSPLEVTHVSYAISTLNLRVKGVKYAVILGDNPDAGSVVYGPLVTIPEMLKARKLSGIDAWKTLFRQAGVKVRHQFLTPMAQLCMLGIIVLFFVIAIRNA